MHFHGWTFEPGDRPCIKALGVDFSKYALKHAKSQSNGQVQYLHADYLNDNLPSGFDVAGLGIFNGRQEISLIEERLMAGFWAEGDYVGIQKSFIYDDQYLALDRYIIVEPAKTWQIFN